LSRISKAISKPVLRVASLVHCARYDQRAAVVEQEKLFAQLGLSRLDGLAAIEAVFSAHPELVGSMRSEHLVLFGAISKALDAKRILEIGTYDGKCAAVLALLFPNAHIDTIDLPDSHPIFASSYKRRDDGVRTAFIKQRNELLGRYHGIHFEQLNSVALSEQSREKYDLIWVDGDHGYPTVAIDIVNAFRMLSPDGLILCDDVRTTSPRDHGPNSVYGSVGAFQTLEALRDAGIAEFLLVNKRLDAKSNADPRRRKFVAVAGHTGQFRNRLQTTHC
jgi:predicted O-methyltransferase YrrM